MRILDLGDGTSAVIQTAPPHEVARALHVAMTSGSLTAESITPMHRGTIAEMLASPSPAQIAALGLGALVVRGELPYVQGEHWAFATSPSGLLNIVPVPPRSSTVELAGWTLHWWGPDDSRFDFRTLRDYFAAVAAGRDRSVG